jgi:hypothetical protein
MPAATEAITLVFALNPGATARSRGKHIAALTPDAAAMQAALSSVVRVMMSPKGNSSDHPWASNMYSG